MKTKVANSNFQTETSASAMYIAAQEYCEEREWAVFPLVANEKRPATKNGYKDAETASTKLSEWFASGCAYNIGIPTGIKSGVVVIDLDEKNGVSGSASIAALEKEYGPLPETLRSETPSGGQHIFFLYPADADLRNRTAVLPGVDVRAEGGYVVAPPSVIDSKQYTWKDKLATIAELPGWLLNLIRSQKSAPVKEFAAVPSTVIALGSRNDSMFRFVLGQMRSGYAREKVEDATFHANKTLCNPPLMDDEVRQIIENVYRLQKDQPERDLTDIGNGKKMSELHGQSVRYILETKDGWLQWVGTFWKRVSQTVINGLSKDVPAALHAEADALPQGPDKTALKKHAVRTSAKARLEATVELFKSEAGIGVSMSILDKNDYLFSVKNGVIDLKTGKFLPPDPGLLITQVAGTAYDAEASCPRWEAFLNEVMAGDPELVTYLQRAIGYALSGSIKEHCLFFAYGFGANGKSTFLNVVRALFGDLGMQASSETLMETKRSSSGTSSDIARLRGKRFVAMSETDDGRHLNEGMVKSLTGGDPIIARDLYQSIFEFNPTHKFFLASNHRPTIKGTDHGIWRRIRLIPFSVKIPEERRNPNLEPELMKELPGILNWAIKGCLDWQQYGMPIPKAIERATQAYKDDMDIFGSWMAEFCELGEDKQIEFSAAYKSFDPWCKENYNFSFSKKRFGQMFVEREFLAFNRNGRWYKGISLGKKLTGHIRQSLEDEV